MLAWPSCVVGKQTLTLEYERRGGGGRVGKSVKNSTDTIFELEILAQKTHAKICQMCTNEPKNAKKMQNFAKFCKNAQKHKKIVQNAQYCAFFL